jgi:pimeloyl-ACP methyl ester carboxylesterase
VDRAGYGHSDADPNRDEASQADDVVALADGLGLERFAVLGWSSGGPTALALAARHPGRVAAVGVAAGQPAMIADRGDQTPEDFATVAAPFVAQPGMTVALAMEASIEGWDARSLADLASVEGLHEQLALSLAAAVERGLAGVEGDLRAMVLPWPFELEAISIPVTMWYGTEDLADRIPRARLEILEGASHLLPLTNWSLLLDSLAQQLDMEEHSCR